MEAEHHGKPRALIGSATAPVRITEFADTLCGHCAELHRTLTEIRLRDPRWASQVHLLDDCASPVVVPGVVDFTDPAEAAYARFAEAGMHRALSTTPMDGWPGL